MKKSGLRLLTAVVVVAGLVIGVAPQAAWAPPAPSLPACTAAQLVPQLGATMVNQGVASYADSGYKLGRRKDTLVRFFLVNQAAVGSTCSGTTYVRSANLTVTNAATASHGPIAALQTFGSSGTAIPSSTVQVDSNADPKFVVPADRVNSCLVDLAAAACDDSASGFSLNFAASITYSTSLSSTPVALSLTSVTKDFDRSTNALRVLAIPMGDASQSYSTQFSDSAKVAVQNGFSALSRIYPVPGGVSSTLNTTTGGIRYKLDLAAMLNLKSVAGAYNSSNKFCGTQANFDGGIKGLLAGYLSVYNSSITDTSQAADRVLGVVDKNISDGSSANCAEGMASTSSPEAWVRAIPDQPAGGGKPAVPSMTGALMAMEFAHTHALDTTLSYHSANTQADATAVDRAYNLSSRSYLSDDRSAMRFVSSNPFNNNNALLERDAYERMLCNLGGSLASLPGTSTACTTSAVAGTVVAAGPTFAIFGTSDLATADGTRVLESYESEDDPIFVDSDGSALKLKFFDALGNHIDADVAVPYSNVSSLHHSTDHINTTNAVFGGVFDAPAGYATVKLVYNGTVLYQRSSAPLESVSAGIGELKPGGSLTIDKTLTTPVIPPKPDVVFLADTTGSMGAALDDMKTNVQSIMDDVLDVQPQAQFAAASYKDFGCTVGGVEETPFKLEQALTTSTSAVQTAVNSWTTYPGSGCDKPEAQVYALWRLATGTDVGWRTGSSRVVVWFGDAPGHDPSGDKSLADDTIPALKAAGIRVIAINLVNDGESSSLDQTGQATQVVNATGGVLKTNSDLGQVSSEILAGLRNLPATVTPQLTSCDSQLSVAFAPESQTVTSGEQVSFTETVNIAETASPGSTLTCTVRFLVNGLAVDDPAFTQTLSLELSGEREFLATFVTSNPQNVRAHVIYDCGNGEKEPAFVALEGAQVGASIVQFQENVNTTLSCANATGTASLTIVATNGVDAESQTIPTSPSTLPVSNKPPSAAIYQPTVDAVIPYRSQLSLNGHVADPEDGNVTARWTIVSAPTGFVPPTIPDGEVVDVSPPAGGWPAGDYVIQLNGTDSDGNTDTAQVTVHVANYTFAGFYAPVENPPVWNAGKGGNTYPLKWSLSQGGATVSDLSAVVAIRVSPVGCGAQLVDTLETTTTGGTSLRYDSTTQQYVYNWQTPRGAGCYVVSVTLADGATYPAFFQLK